MGAASYVQGVRLTRPRKTQEYYQWVRELCARNSPNLKKENPQDLPMSENEVLLETLMLGLRLASGLSLSGLVDKFGEKTVDRIWQCLQPYWRQGWVEIARSNSSPIATLTEGERLPQSGYLRLSDPEGFLFSNTILSTLFSKLGEDR
jgi:oxygen-independent coproporphyrinogen-3 oxidase